MKDSFPTIEIEYNKGRLLFFFMLSCGFLVMMSMYSLVTIHEIILEEASLIQVGLCFIYFLAAITAFCYRLIKLLDERPGLILNETGIIDQSTAFRGLLIEWKHITRYETQEVGYSKILKIFLENPQAYLDQVNIIQQILLKRNMWSYKTPICLAENSIIFNFDMLVETVDSRIKQLG